MIPKSLEKRTVYVSNDIENRLSVRGLQSVLGCSIMGSVKSGRFVIRVPSDLHERMCSLAETQGTSLNTFVVSGLSYVVGIFNASQARKAEIRKGGLPDVQAAQGERDEATSGV